jgi:hypothetical protein
MVRFVELEGALDALKCVEERPGAVQAFGSYEYIT